MKKIFITLSVLFFVSGGCKPKTTPDKLQTNPLQTDSLTVPEQAKILSKDKLLNKKIKAIYEKYYFDNGRIDSCSYFFNESGLLITEKAYRSTWYQKTVYTYNADNQEVRRTRYDKDGMQTDYIESTYGNGNLVKRFFKHAVSTPRITYYLDYQIDTYKYDDSGNVIEKKEIYKRKDSKNEEIQSHIKYQYDSEGNRIIEEKLNSKGEVVEGKKNRYVNRKLMETATWMLFEGEDLYLKDTYEYDKNDTMRLHTNIVYTYGSSTIEAYRQTENYSYEYEYDINGTLIGETKTKSQTNKPIEKFTWKYIDFDDYGNWTQKKLESTIIKREIEYY